MARDAILRGDGTYAEIRKVKHGEKITEPGIYDMPMSWYHADCCAGPSISSSGLRTIVLKTPLHYWDESYLNPHRPVDDQDETESVFLRIGRAGHTLLLEPELFRSQFVTRDPRFTSWMTKESKKWRLEQQLEGFTVMDPPEMLRVQGVANALRNHPLYARGLLDGDIERSLIWQDPATGVWLKARPDVIPEGSNIWADLKVVSSADARAVEKKVFGFGYDMQMALGEIGMQVLLGRSIEEFVVVCIESSRPHGIRIAPIALEEIKRARSLLRAGLTTFVECLEAGYWPSYDAQEGEYVRRPEWAAKRIDADIERGLLPKEF